MGIVSLPVVFLFAAWQIAAWRYLLFVIHDAIDWLNNNQGFTNALLTAIYVVATIVLVAFSFLGTRIAQKSLKAVEQFERERSRPYITVALVNQPLGIIQLVIENVGATAAYNISIKTEPVIMMVEGGKNVDPPKEYEKPHTLIAKGLGFLPPKGREQSIIALSPERFVAVYPTERFEGSVSYTDAQEQLYEHRILIDLSWQRDLGFYTPPDVAEEVEKLREMLERKLK